MQEETCGLKGSRTVSDTSDSNLNGFQRKQLDLPSAFIQVSPVGSARANAVYGDCINYVLHYFAK